MTDQCSEFIVILTKKCYDARKMCVISKNFRAISFTLGLFSVLTVTKYNESKARHGSGHPDFLEGSIFAKKLLEVAFASITVQISNVKPESIFLVVIVKTPVISALATPAATWTSGS